MRTGTSITVSATDRRRLEKIVSDRNAAQKPVWWSEIVLLTARGLGTHAIMARTGKAKATVWRWRQRFAEAGVEGFLCDATRPRGKAPIPTEKVAEVVRLTRATHWTARAMARAAELDVATELDRMVSQGRRDPCGGVAAYIRSAPAECKAGMGGGIG